MSIFLDTNALPRRGRLLNLLISSLLQVARHRGLQPCLTDVVLNESTNSRRQAIACATRKLDEATRSAAKVIDQFPPIYLPDPEAEAQRWRRELEGAFDIVSTTGEDAVEALHREALRLAPATGGRGARDASIWLTVCRHHRQNPSSTYFVSTDDEAFGDGAGNLSVELQSELSDGFERFHYLRSVNDLLALLATERADLEVAVGLLAEAESMALDALEAIGLLQIAEEEWDLEGSLSLDEVAADARGLELKRAYEVDDVVLALVEVDYALRPRTVDAQSFVASATLWLGLDGGASEIYSIEADSFVRNVESDSPVTA